MHSCPQGLPDLHVHQLSSCSLSHSCCCCVQAQGRKLETPLLYPLVLDMRPFTAGAVTRKRHRLAPTPAAPALLYELYAVVVHKGNLQVGLLLAGLSPE